MNKKKLFFLLTVGGISTVCVIFLFFGWQKNQVNYLGQQDFYELPLVEARGVEFIGWDEQGKKSWVINAQEATRFEKYAILKEVRVKLFEEGDLVSEGIAEKVKLEDSNLLLEGDVYIKSYKEKAELKTSQLIWNGSERMLYTEKEVTVKKGGFIIKGKGLIGKPDLSLIIIKSQVTTYFEGGS